MEGVYMDQNLSLYKIFYTVASTGNISHAAEALYISQPAISKSIRKLEQSLNTTLFSRTSRGVRLTDEGALLFDYVKSAFDFIEAGEQQLKMALDLGIGHLRIGVSTTLCKYLLLPYLQRFIGLHPHIKIAIECQSTNQTLQLLEERKIDIGLIGRPERFSHIHFQPLTEIEDIFVSTRSYLDNLMLRLPGSSCTQEHSPASIQEIAKAGTLMLLDKENMTRQYINDYLKEHAIEPNNLIEISSMDLLIDFAKISLGIACVIKKFVEKELDDGSLIQIPLPCPIHKRQVGFAWPADITPSPSVKEFLDFLDMEK